MPILRFEHGVSVTDARDQLHGSHRTLLLRQRGQLVLDVLGLQIKGRFADLCEGVRMDGNRRRDD
jgi:hypothetical protein